jgi:hypothetical protein
MERSAGPRSHRTHAINVRCRHHAGVVQSLGTSEADNQIDCVSRAYSSDAREALGWNCRFSSFLFWGSAEQPQVQILHVQQPLIYAWFPVESDHSMLDVLLMNPSAY